MITTYLQQWAQRRTAWRRAHNLRRAAPRAKSAGAPRRRLSLSRWAAALFVATGALLIGAHARHLVTVTAPLLDRSGGPTSLDALQAVFPGLSLQVTQAPGVSLSAQLGGALLIASGLQGAPAVHIDLCAQMIERSKGQLLPVRVGYKFDDVARWVAHNQTMASPVALRNVLLASAGDTMPQVQISGSALADFDQPLQLSWQGQAGWLGDASFGQIERGAHGQVALRREGWLVWDATHALRIERRASAACAQAGELLFQVYAPGENAQERALVTAYPVGGAPVSVNLRPGQYQVPLVARAALEDQHLFLDLQAHALVRLDAAGQIELAPRDLVGWRAAAPEARAGDLSGWNALVLDPATRKLLKRLYTMADGDYVRQQVDIFNSERRLLAWRMRPAQADAAWRVQLAELPAGTSAAMPPAAARLFAELPQGWAPWTRIAQWPRQDTRQPARLTWTLAAPALGGETVELMLIGQLAHVEGARLRAPARAVCSGRSCPAEDAVLQLTLELLPGTRTVTLDAQPLALSERADQPYRHLRVLGGRLDWQALRHEGSVAAAPPARADLLLTDRNGTPLWRDGAPTDAARVAGLAPLLGVRAEHANSVAGMLARLPGGAQTARLSLDLPLQTLSEQTLACVGMRRGHWDGVRCSGGQAAPAGRHAGIVILDAETGDLLAAAGAGMAPVDAANWSEVRDFDRADPARSPLRLPALQHDGGIHSSPGSTFKVISALGLEAAAAHDGQLNSLLGGLPLAAINQLAARRGFDFRTDAATYPADSPLAHITNYQEQQLDRRAQDGRLGLAQALSYSLNTWFAWTGELSDASLFGRADGGAPDLQPLDARALEAVRPIVGAAHRLGFEQALRLDGGLLPTDYPWSRWDALQASAAHIDPVHTRHELRQMAIGLRMQVTPLQMALAAGAIGQGRTVAPRLLLALDDRPSVAVPGAPLGVRLDRIRAGMKGVIDVGTGAGAFKGAALAPLRAGLYGKTGTAPTTQGGAEATVWFSGWLEPGSLPGQTHRLALAAFVSHSEASGGEHAAPVVAAILTSLLTQKGEQKGK